METLNPNIETNDNDKSLKDLRNNVEKSIKNPEITKREGLLSYCRVLPGDTIPKIRNRLAKYDEFAYLKEPIYGGNGRNVNGFNIEPRHLKPGMNLMVPIKIEKREVDDKAFLEYCQRAIDRIKSHQIYGKKITELVNKVGINNLIRVMSAFARVETANGNSGTKIGTGGLYRYESTDTYSVSYYHIITKRGGANALKNLNMNIGDTCDPVKAGMLFLGFWCEVEKDVQKKGLTLEKCLNPKQPERYKNAAKIYNPNSKSYPHVLQTSYSSFVKKG